MQGHYHLRCDVFGKQNDAWREITYSPILYRTPITASSKTNHTPGSNSYKRTRCSFRANTAPVSCIQPTKINARPLYLRCDVFGKQNGAWGKTTYASILYRTPIKALSKVNHTPRNNSCKRTYCSSRANTTHSPYIQPTKIHASPVIAIEVYSENKLAHTFNQRRSIKKRRPVIAIVVYYQFEQQNSAWDWDYIRPRFVSNAS